MGRYYGESQPGGYGLKRPFAAAPRHTARTGIFPYTPTESDRVNKASIALRMREKFQAPTEEISLPERIVDEVQLGNQELPSYEKKDEIVETVRHNQVTVIVGPTGSGKSTQVPQYLLEAGFDNISVTQPRIMAANGVGDRIAYELEQSLGEEATGLVAVQTSERFDHQEEAKIFIRTDGLEQIMQLEKYLKRLSVDEADEVAAQTVLVVDEVHESNVNQVGLLALSKRLIDQYPDLRVVVMSATANAEKYATYFGGGVRDVPVVEIEGQPAELEWKERPDVDAIQMVKELFDDGSKLELGDDILLFTSGKNEIKRLIEKGKASGVPIEFVGLHASMTSAEQARSTSEHPETIRVIVATDVAMTSLTFPHVKYVVDEGIVKNPELDEEGASGLVPEICSQAEIWQRGGRAGRVRPGTHILVSPHEETGMSFVSFERRREYPTPPIYATDLSRNILQFASYDIDFAELDLIDPVSSRSIRQAKDKLYNLGALDEDDTITDIGKMMNKFPVGTEYSRMIAEAMKPGVPLNVLVNVIAVAASYESKGLRSFLRRYEKGKEPWRRVAGAVDDDVMLERNLFVRAGLAGDEEYLRTLQKQGYDVKNLLRARKAYRKCTRAVGLDPFQTPIGEMDDDETMQMYHCVASGLVENIYVRSRSRAKNGVRRYHPSNGVGLAREISNRSVVNSDKAPMVAGMSRFYMAQSKDKDGGSVWKKFDIVESVQHITPEEVAKLDLRETSTVAGFVARGGMVQKVVERRAGNLRRGTELRATEAGEVDEGTMLQAVLENPGAAQGELKAIKRELENLQQLTTRTVRQLPQVDFEKLLLQAIRQAGSTEFHVIDAVLGGIMQDRGIVKDQFIAPGLEEDIRRKAVETVTVGDETIVLKYQQGKPIALHVSPAALESFPDTVTIPDGRDVLFRVPKLSRENGKVIRGSQDVPIHLAKQTVKQARNIL